MTVHYWPTFAQTNAVRSHIMRSINTKTKRKERRVGWRQMSRAIEEEIFTTHTHNEQQQQQN